MLHYLSFNVDKLSHSQLKNIKNEKKRSHYARYFSGRHPVGSGRVDYARSRIAETAREVKDYAREHGIYFPGRTKDAAPGA